MEATDTVLIIDKKVGLSSAQVVAKVKAITKAGKAGHAGTLDPFASGVLVCCLNRATRLAQYLLSDEKQYRAVLRLGITTDTLDNTGRVVDKKPVPQITADQMASVLQRYTGQLMQTPPLFSALKHQGKPLYYWARKGTPVQKKGRQVTITALEATGVELPDVTLDITCSAGTYIRQLGFDIGRTLGCGGHLTRLARLRSGMFALKQALTLEQLESAVKAQTLGSCLVQPADALYHMAEHMADELLTRKVIHGRLLTFKDGFGVKHRSPFKIVSSDRKLLAIVEADKTTDRLKYRAVFI